MRIIVFIFLGASLVLYAQNGRGKLSGHISNKKTNEYLVNANITATPGNYGTVTDSLGNFNLILPYGTYGIKISYVGFNTSEINITISKNNPYTKINIKLEPKVITQKEVHVSGQKEIFSPVTQKLERISIIRMPTIYSDVLKSVKILAGVTSNNELTSGYNVRGGNYNENLIYLDGFEIYRPFIITQGIEENQSIVNGDLIKNLNFNGGTFPARLGDKMSSALELTYKDKFDSTLSGTARAGILNSGLSLFKRFGKLNLAGAIRYSYPKLFTTSSIQTTGNYRPTYFDIQVLGNYRFSSNSNLELLFINAYNKFQLRPETWQGNFPVGILDIRELTLTFSGYEKYSFNTRLTGLKYNTQLKKNLHLSILGSLYSTAENFHNNLLNNVYYIDNRFYSHEDTAYLKSQYNFADDKLNMDMYELKSIINYQTGIHNIEAGAELRYYKFINTVNETSYDYGPDSVLNMSYNNVIGQNVKFPSYSGYIQDITNFNKKIQTEAGIRILRYNFTKETLISPRLSINYFYSPSSMFNFSSGFYYQPPFYYEVSNKNIVNSTTTLKSQRAINFMLTWNTKTDIGNKYTMDVYYKKLDNLIPYYIDKLKLVYGDKNNYEGYAEGFDFQFEGELVKGIKSWIGYSFLDTRERVKGSGAHYVRRLLDQRHTLKIFLQDRFKKHPNFQVHARFLFGSGFLYHPRITVKDPVTNKYYIKIDYSDRWVLPFYFRTDMGLSNKLFLGNNTNVVIIVEVYNVFNKRNIASFNWYHIFPETNQLIGVPIIFSSRFFSVEAEINF